MPWRPTNRLQRQPRNKFPIDGLLVAGSFIHDFRTPPAPETLQVS
jgi:hypothetical protein